MFVFHDVAHIMSTIRFCILNLSHQGIKPDKLQSKMLIESVNMDQKPLAKYQVFYFNLLLKL